MENTVDLNLKVDEKAELKKLLQRFDEVMARYEAQKNQDWKEMEELQASTRAKLAQLRKAA